MDSVIETLLLPYRKGLVETPCRDARLLFLNAENHIFLKELAAPVLVQPRHDKARALIENGYKIAPPEPDGKFNTVWILPGKGMEETQYLFAQTLRAAAEGAIIIAAAANDAGGKRLGGLFEELGLSPEEESKHKARVVFATVGQTYNTELAEQWFAEGQEQHILSGDLISRPGLYGWDKVDTGSALLARHLPADLSGRVADFGCGWGYLSLQALAVSKNITHLTLVDIDSRAVGIGRRNVLGKHSDVPVETIWTDLTYPDVKLGTFDTILLNPPFHDGTHALPALGQAIITMAARSLKPSGRLYLVANRHLPYEKTLNALFGQVNVSADADGFKAFVCRRG